MNKYLYSDWLIYFKNFHIPGLFLAPNKSTNQSKDIYRKNPCNVRTFLGEIQWWKLGVRTLHGYRNFKVFFQGKIGDSCGPLSWQTGISPVKNVTRRNMTMFYYIKCNKRINSCCVLCCCLSLWWILLNWINVQQVCYKPVVRSRASSTHSHVWSGLGPKLSITRSEFSRMSYRNVCPIILTFQCSGIRNIVVSEV